MPTLSGLAMTLLMFACIWLVARKTQPYFVPQQKELGKLNGFTEEMISGQKAILLFSREKKVETEFADINGK
ncbi:MAG: ABC transporter transmembrane domain-containing protein [Spirochaetes bacterium]|nr:ABC transporter transmembrane domain-containing protein [Spirochaetota bacterium]